MTQRSEPGEKAAPDRCMSITPGRGHGESEDHQLHESSSARCAAGVTRTRAARESAGEWPGAAKDEPPNHVRAPQRSAVSFAWPACKTERARRAGEPLIQLRATRPRDPRTLRAES